MKLLFEHLDECREVSTNGMYVCKEPFGHDSHHIGYHIDGINHCIAWPKGRTVVYTYHPGYTVKTMYED
jgi:hypothetical protein